MQNVGRARNWQLWADDLYTEVTVKAGLTVSCVCDVFRPLDSVNFISKLKDIVKFCSQLEGNTHTFKILLN